MSRVNLLEKSSSFQKRVVPTWNPNVQNISDLIILPLSLRDESTKIGTGMVVVELAVEVGLLKGEIAGPHTLADDWESRTFFLFGDAFSIQNYVGFVKSMNTSTTSFDRAYESGIIYKKALSRFIPIPGDWHFGMNMVCNYFKLFYGAFLEPIKTMLGIKRLTEDPTTTYQTGLRLIRLAGGEVEQLLLDVFCAQDGNLNAASNAEGTITQHDIDSALAEEEKQKLKMRACRQLVHIEQLFQKQLHQWLEGSDEVFVFLSNIVIQKRRLELFLKSVRDLDVPLIERLYVDMLPIWEATGSNKYVRLTLDLIETLYKKISFSQLQELRINKCIRLYTQRSTEISEDCGTAMDAIAELVNKRLKQGKQAKDIIGWNKQSELVGLTWRCVNFTDRNYTAKDHGEDIDDD